MMDINTLQFIRNYVRKRIEETRQDICYGIDTLDRLHYAKGRSQRIRDAATGSKRPAT
jgi:hypothetical protein